MPGGGDDEEEEVSLAISLFDRGLVYVAASTDGYVVGVDL